MRPSILVLSANSKVGLEVVRNLGPAGHPVRAAVRDTGKTALLEDLGVKVVAADLDRPETLATALDGIQRALLSTAADARQVEQHGAFICAAKAAGVEHVVRISAVGANHESPLKLLRMHGTSEQELERSGLAFTHIRPRSFMQNFVAAASTVIHQSSIYGCAGGRKFAFVDLRDVAALASAVLTQPGHEGKTYEASGPEALSYGEVAERLSVITGRKITYIDVPPEAVRGAMASIGLPEWLAGDLATIMSQGSTGHEEPVSPHIEQVAGRVPYSMDRFLADYGRVFRG